MYTTLLFSLLLFAFCKAQWVSLGTGISPAAPHDVWSISVVDENTIWAVTFDDINLLPTDEFTRTTDGGLTWHPGKTGVPSDEGFLNICAVDSLTAWVTTTPFNSFPIHGGIYKTVNGGINWIHQNKAYFEINTGPTIVHFYDRDNGFSFGCPASSIFRAYWTNDGGDTWEPASIPISIPLEYVEYNTGNGQYAVVGDKAWFVTNKARVFKSDDRGHNWYVAGQAITPTPPVNSGPNSLAFRDSLNGIVVSYGPPEAWRTTDGGITWEQLTNFPDKNVIQIEFIPGTKGAYIAHGGWGAGTVNIVKTCDDGMNWEVITANRNVNTLEFLSRSVGYGGDRFTNPTSNGMFKWDSDLLLDCDTIEVVSKVTEGSVAPISLFPNPTTDFLSIQLPEPANIPSEAYIFDARGKLLRKQQIANEQSLHLQGLTPGIYLLKIVAGERVFSAKFVKQ